MFRPLSAIVLSVGLATGAQAALFNGNAGVPGSETAGMQFQVVYELAVPGTSPGFRNAVPVAYTVNNSGSIAIGSYDRIGYYVEVTSGTQAGQFVYVSMDAFDANAARIGLPHNVNNPVARQTIVANANIYSNNGSIVTGTGVNSVNLEMWPSNYGTGTTGTIPGGSGSTFDFNDSGFNTAAGHGSFQIHNFTAGQTLFGWSDWGGSNVSSASEFGIGNATLLSEPHPDWTFSDRGQTGFIQIVVARIIPEPATVSLGLIGLAGLMIRRRRVIA